MSQLVFTSSQKMGSGSGIFLGLVGQKIGTSFAMSSHNNRGNVKNSC